MPTDDDITSVTIEELDDMLDESQKDQLQTLLSPLSNSDFPKQGMIGTGQVLFINQFQTLSVQA